MNLWAKSFRQLPLLAAALFFFSCEDETSLLGYPNPNKKFEVQYVEIPLDVSSLLTIDSILTDVAPRAVGGQAVTEDGLLVGAYDDPLLGRVEATSFITIYPTTTTALPERAEFDSVTVQFRLNFLAYGGTPEKQTRQFAIHQITGDTLTFFDGNRYYSHSEGPSYSSDPLGYAVVSAEASHYDSLAKQATATTNRDTVLARGRLADSFGMQLFDAVKSTVDHQAFKANIKGLVAVPADPAGILGFDVVTPFGQLSRVELHYHTLDEDGHVKDTLMRSFGVNYTSYSHLTADRTGSVLAAAQPYTSFVPDDNLRYVQSGVPVLTKIDLAPFYAFADTLQNIQINQAELVIDGVSSSSSLRPHRGLLLMLMKNDADQFLNSRVAADREFGLGYYAESPHPSTFPDLQKYRAVVGDGSPPVPITYDAGKGRFSGLVTLFAQSLFREASHGDAVNDDRLRYVALYPGQPKMARSVTRTVFDKNSVKLRIHYTRATTTTTP